MGICLMEMVMSFTLRVSPDLRAKQSNIHTRVSNPMVVEECFTMLSFNFDNCVPGTN